MELTKICVHCNVNKSINEFHKSKKAKDGLSSWCKECKTMERKKQHSTRTLSNYLCECGCGQYTYLAVKNRKEAGWVKGEPLRFIEGHYNKGFIGDTEVFKTRMARNGYKICADCNEKFSIDNFYKYKGNLDGLADICKKCSNKRHKEYKKSDKGKIFYHYHYKIKKARDRAKKFNAKGNFSKKELIDKINYYGGNCWVCGNEYQEIDHVIPFNKGGSNFISNIKPICKKCNNKKGSHWYGVNGIKELKKFIKEIKEK